jgi:hypothetical protein
VALSLSVDELLALARLRLSVPLIASVQAPNATFVEALLAHAGLPVAFVAGQTAVVGTGPDGRPQLVELRGPPTALSGASAPSAEPAPAPPPFAREPIVETPRFEPAPRARPPRPVSGAFLAASMGAPSSSALSSHGDDPLPELPEAPPSSWSSADIDDDPGWELSALAPVARAGPPVPGSFDAALQRTREQAQQTAQLQAQMPRVQPPPHPQARALRGAGGGGDPFGGLTFEPPSGPAGSGGPGPDDEDTP